MTHQLRKNDMVNITIKNITPEKWNDDIIDQNITYIVKDCIVLVKEFFGNKYRVRTIKQYFLTKMEKRDECD